MPYEVWDALKSGDLILWVAAISGAAGLAVGVCLGACLTPRP